MAASPTPLAASPPVEIVFTGTTTEEKKKGNFQEGIIKRRNQGHRIYRFSGELWKKKIFLKKL